MRHLAAFLLLVAGGNATPTAEDVTNVLSQAGMESDPERLTALLAELDGKDVNQCVALGKSKLMVGGGMASSSGGSAAPAAAGAPGSNIPTSCVIPVYLFVIHTDAATNTEFDLNVPDYFTQPQQPLPLPRNLLRKKSMPLTVAWTCSEEAALKPETIKKPAISYYYFCGLCKFLIRVEAKHFQSIHASS